MGSKGPGRRRGRRVASPRRIGSGSRRLPVARRGARRARLPALAWVLIGLTLCAAANYLVQVARKPSELLGLVAGPDPLGPRETWARYGALCREHSTELVRPALLAALVQVESAGDPRARTYWRWRWSWNPFQLYAPASSAVGILQITDGTFEEARTLCIHRHAVARAGAWYDPHACWFNALYLRTSAGDSIEMTAARLHVVTAEALAAAGRRPGAEQVDALAAVIHLCGRARGRAFAARGFRPLPGERCGDHDLGGYLARMRGLVALFTREAGG